jgi:hypothetical protein
MDVPNLTFLVCTVACQDKLIGSRPKFAVFPMPHLTIAIPVVLVETTEIRLMSLEVVLVEVTKGKCLSAIDVTYDDFPTEISWSVKLSGTSIISKPEGSIQTPGLVQEQIKLNPGTYDFEISDSFGDGICCRFKDGNYVIYAETAGGDSVLATGNGQFGRGETKSFTVPDPNSGTTSGAPVSTPSATPNDSPVVSPVASTTGPVSVPGSGGDPVAPAIPSTDLSPTLPTAPFASPVALTFEPVSSAETSAPAASFPTAPAGAPFFSPVARPTPSENPNNDSTAPIASPSTSSLAPEPAPAATSVTPYPTRFVPSSTPVDTGASPAFKECGDTTDTFPIDDILGNKDCAWLAENRVAFGYLCELIDVAAACKVTCNTCQYFFLGKV